MYTFRSFLRPRKKWILAFFLFGLIFLCSFALYHLPVQAVFYPYLLCGAIGCLWIFLEFQKEKKKYELLESIKNHITTVLDDGSLPECGGVEAVYQDMIRILYREKEETGRKDELKYRDLTDYYTAWVHQIKIPIASMDLMLQTQDTSFSRKIARELVRIEQYVEMVLTFLRLNSDSSDYVFRETAMDPLIRQCIKKFSGEFIDRKIRLHYTPVSMKVITDEKWICFVIEQILSNALKYTLQGEIRIYEEEGNRLFIQDTGIGIAPEDLPRIFEKGYTGCNGRTDKKATGLGLYLCRKICLNLNCGLSVKSVPGEGTTVCMDLNPEHVTGKCYD